MARTQEERVEQLKRLLQRKEEGRDLDYKRDLHLETEGDKAEFVKDVLALANSAEVGYIVTGVEDKTWRAVGIQKHHEQIRLNDILKDKTDPPLEVEYSEQEVDGLDHGMVTIRAPNPPYLVAVADRYGGKLSTARRKQSYIVRGSVYVRIQDKNELASRVHVDKIYEARYGREDEARELTKRFVEQDAKEMDGYHLENNESFIRLIICPRGTIEPILDWLSLSDSEFRRGFQEEVLSVPVTPAEKGMGGVLMPPPRRTIAEEETIKLIWREKDSTPIEILKMDIRGNVSSGHVSVSNDKTIGFFGLRGRCEWVFQVVAQLYRRYDTGQTIDKVTIALRLRNFKRKLLVVQLNRPGLFDLYQYASEEDPRIFPRVPMETSVSDLAERPDRVAADLTKLFRRSYPRQVR